MPLNFSAAYSSRITKAKPSLRRSASSPFAGFARRKPVQRSKSKPEAIEEEDDLFGDRLDDAGLVASLADDLSLRDVAQAIQYVHSHMFDELPERGGMNSTRIAEVLNFRKSLPPIVTVAHVHAMIGQPTAVEKEIAELTKAGIIRKFVVPGRSVGGASIGDGLILAELWERMIMEASELPEDLRSLYLDARATGQWLTCALGRFIEVMRTSPTALIIPRATLTPLETTALMRAGFITSSSQGENSQNDFSSSSAAAMGTLTSISSISRAASGSLAAVGGESAFHEAGGGGGAISRNSSVIENPSGRNYHEEPANKGNEFCLSLPSTGPYLRLLVSARNHLMFLLAKSKYREAPSYLLRERWDGGVVHDDAAAKSKKARGEFVGILPGRTRKWKQFYGLSFNWVLEGCLGAGMVEVFETGSVGRGVRAIK
ncbi:hypothetical protein MMC16_005673 [Acarospora aff. strigata]|nr:hypothetical protein [Acarospora aff. strigata]